MEYILFSATRQPVKQSQWELRNLEFGLGRVKYSNVAILVEEGKNLGSIIQNKYQNSHVFPYEN